MSTQASAGGEGDQGTDTGQGTDTTNGTTTNTDTTGTAGTTGTTEGTTSTTADGADTAAELAKWKDMARKHEERAKANAAAVKELEQLKKSSMSDAEKAIATAREEARREVLAEVGASLVDSAVRAATAGRNLDADALLDGLDRKRFLGDDGKPDVDGIGQWIDRLAPKAAAGSKQQATDMGQGARGGGTPAQIRDRAALQKMTSDQIVKALDAGQLTELMRG